MFSNKATKIEDIFTINLTLCSRCQLDAEDFINFCGLLKKHKFTKKIGYLYSLDRQWRSRFTMILLKWFIMILKTGSPKDHYKPFQKDHYKPRTSLMVQAVYESFFHSFCATDLDYWQQKKWKNEIINFKNSDFFKLRRLPAKLW